MKGDPTIRVLNHGARLSEYLHGPTNPTWIERLMGFPRDGPT
jgi:hypothetical protein